MKTPYRILKLRSGEQLITRIRGEEKGKLILERPMIFMTRTIMDPYMGRQRDLTVLKNWLSHTDEIHTKIPKDYIATFLTPTTDIIELYTLEKEKEDVNPITPKLTDVSKLMGEDTKEQKTLGNMDPEEVENLIDMMRDAIEENPDLLEDIEDMEEDLLPPKTKNFITMTMMLPPEALLSLVDAGLIDHEDVLDLIENLNGSVHRKKYTGDDKERKEAEDFGNLWTDWSPDLKDYLE